METTDFQYHKLQILYASGNRLPHWPADLKVWQDIFVNVDKNEEISATYAKWMDEVTAMLGEPKLVQYGNAVIATGPNPRAFRALIPFPLWGEMYNTTIAAYVEYGILEELYVVTPPVEHS